MLKISNQIHIPENEIRCDAIRAQGAGGQHVNKVSTAVHLRFDIRMSSLPESCKKRLLKLKDQRISKEGIIVIKAQSFRSREKNREDALSRLKEMILAAMVTPKKRKATKPSAAAKRRRLEQKSRQARIKKLRGRVQNNE